MLQVCLKCFLPPSEGPLEGEWSAKISESSWYKSEAVTIRGKTEQSVNIASHPQTETETANSIPFILRQRQ